MGKRLYKVGSIGVFLSPVIAAALLLMFGSNIDKTKLIDKKYCEYKTYRRARVHSVVVLSLGRAQWGRLSSIVRITEINVAGSYSSVGISAYLYRCRRTC